MTQGHNHVMRRVSRDGLVLKVLRKPLLHIPTVNPIEYHRIDTSPYPYGKCTKHSVKKGMDSTCWTLSLLGILHRWTGLTLVYVE